jgi:peptidase MA superfamily protein
MRAAPRSHPVHVRPVRIAFGVAAALAAAGADPHGGGLDAVASPGTAATAVDSVAHSSPDSPRPPGDPDAATLDRYLGPPPWTHGGHGGIRVYAAHGWEGDAASAAAAARSALPRIAGALGVRPEAVLPVWIVISPGGHEYALEAPSWSAAIARPSQHLIVISGAAVQRGEAGLDETVGHELVHLVLHVRIGEQGWIPLWLEEGLAVQFSSDRRVRDRLLRWGRGPVRLEDLESAFPRDADGARAAYLESQSAVRRMLQERPIAPLLDRIAAGAEFDDAFRAVYGVTPAEFAAQVYGEVSRRSRILSVLGSGGTLFAFMTLLVLAAGAQRRRRDRARRRAWEAAEVAEDAEIAADAEPGGGVPGTGPAAPDARHDGPDV